MVVMWKYHHPAHKPPPLFCLMLVCRKGGGGNCGSLQYMNTVLFRLVPREARSLLRLGRDCMASMVIFCIYFKTLPFLINLNFSGNKHQAWICFYLVELSQELHGYSIAELNSSVELFLTTYKIVALSWLEAAGSFACIRDIKSCRVPAS